MSKIEQTKEEKIIEVLKGFRILCQSNSYTVQRLHKVDPRKAPNFKEGSSTEIKWVWQDEGYYGITVSGLKAALKHILIHESVKRLKGSADIKEYLKMVKSISNEISGLVEGVISEELKDS